MGGQGHFHDSIMSGIGAKTRLIFFILAVVVYIGAILFAFPTLRGQAYLFLALPSIAASVFYNSTRGALAALGLSALAIAWQIYSGEWNEALTGDAAIACAVSLIFAGAIALVEERKPKSESQKIKKLEKETDKDKQRKQLRELEYKLRSIFDNASIGYYRITAAEDIVMVNPELLKMMKYPFFEIVFKQNMAQKHYPHHAIPDFRKRMQRDGKIIGIETEWHRYDDSKLFISETAWEVKDENGETLFYDGIITDITERKLQEESTKELLGEIEKKLENSKESETSLRQSLNKYESLAENAGIAIVVADQRGYLKYFNKQFRDIFNYDGKEALRKKLFEFAHPDDEARVKDFYENVVEGGEFRTRIEFKGINGGDIIYIEMEISALEKDENPRGARIYLWDITERKHSEQALMESEERFRGILENATVGYYRTTPQGDILMANKALVNMLRYDSFDELSDMSLEEDWRKPARGHFKEKIEKENIIFGYTDKWERKDGSAITVRESAWLIRDENGNPMYYEGFVEDITEKQEALKDIENLRTRLEKQNKEIKLLESIMPVCASCRKVKNEKGQWVGIREYIENNPDKNFSQKICPECASKISGDNDNAKS